MQQTSGTALAETPRLDDQMQAANMRGDPRTLRLDEREEWRLARRIAASRGFRKSELLQRFLLEVCAQTLAGRVHEITEQQIGIRIFARAEGYDPGEDNIVRSYARTLRKRLEAYFADEGAAEPLRLEIPRGGYVPVFTTAPDAKKSVTAEPPRQSPAQKIELVENAPTPYTHTANLCRRWLALGAMAGAMVTLLAGAAIRIAYTCMHRPAAHALWTQMFERDHDTLIVPADSGLGIVENLTHTQATVDSYASATYFAGLRAPSGVNAGNFNDLSRQRYTSAVSLDISAALVRLPEFYPNRTRIRYARNLGVEEMRNANVILLGSVHSNPWVALFEPRLNFQLVYTPEVDRSFVTNRHPQAGEQPVYRNGDAEGHGPTYGTIAYLPEAGSAQRVLLVGGLNMAATQAAANILFSATAMKPVLRAAAAPGGRLHAFEVLVETTSVDASAPDARIVATRVYPQS